MHLREKTSTLHRFSVQRPVRAYRTFSKDKTEIQKVTSCENSAGTFALLSKVGDVYLLNTEEAPAQQKDSTKDVGARRPTPNLVWGVRRQFTAVKVITSLALLSS